MLIFGTLLVVALAACSSTPASTGPIDRGAYPAGLSSAGAVTLHIHGNVGVSGVDDNKVAWENTDQRQQLVQLESGVHVLKVGYNDGKLQSSSPISLAAQLKSGGSFLLKAFRDDDNNVGFMVVSYVDGQEGEDVTLSLSR
jgi:hypothetical protein